MIEPLVRLGYVSKALIYAVIGGLALAAAVDRGGRVTDIKGALRVIVSRPFGRGLLLFLAVTLCGYALWRVVDAIRDPDRRGTGMAGLVVRIGNLIRGGIYGMFGFEALRLARGAGGSKGNQTELWVARIMDWPGGVWFLALVGAIVAVYGVSEVFRSVKGKTDRTVDYSAIPADVRPLAVGTSLFGVGARGVIIATLGVFLVRAAWQHDPSEAHDTRESMLEIAGAVSGRWLLAAIGAGLIAYAADQIIHARWRRIRPVV